MWSSRWSCVWLCVCIGVLMRECSVEAAGNCTLSQNNKNFLRLPSSTPAAGQAKCSASQQDTCCADSWYADIGVSDPFTKSLEKLKSVNEACRAKVTQLACGVCTPNQRAITLAASYGGVVYPCYSYCSSLLTACGSATLNDRLVSDIYGTDGEWFCFDLFGGLTGNLSVSPKDDATHACFSDEKRECTDDDYYGYYSECDPKTNTRNYYFLAKDTANCAGGVTHPPTKHDLECYQTCPAGSYLPPGSRSCVICAAGSYAIGGGYYYDQWKEWPKEFEWRTYCENTNGINFDSGVEVTNGVCKGWVLNDTWVEVPDYLNDKQNAVLEVKVNLVQAGHVSFTFKVNAEPLYDGLMFKVDGQKIMTFYSNSADYETRTYNLTAGIHTLKWVFFKDLTFSDGHDAAFIRSIEIVGVKYADQSCALCSPGYRSEQGASRCTPCTANTYSDYPGAAGAVCPSCPTDKYSYFAATECFPRPRCNASDYSFSYSPCVNGLRNKNYAFTEPRICDLRDSSILPANQIGVPCAPCNPGQYRGSSSSTCDFCAAGTYSNLGSSSCQKCAPGTYAVKELFYTQFDRWEELPGVSTRCVGACGTNGWRLLSEDIDSGVGHGNIVDVYLVTEVELETEGTATWNFTIVCNDFCRFQFIDVGVSEGSTTYFASDSTRPGPYKFTMKLAKGRHTIQVVFSKYIETVVTHRENRLVIHGFSISGVKSGGASTCTACPAGYYSGESASECTPCPPGTYSSGGASSCTLCPEGTFSNVTAATTCTLCGPNTVSLPNRLDCDIGGCKYQPRPGLNYDLSSLVTREDMYGPVWDVKSHAFFLNPCSREHVNHSCVDKDGKALPTYVCQELPMGYSMDLGNIMGYLPFEDKDLAGNPDDPAASGLIMVFTGGSPGCPKGQSPAFPRSANITFICDPSAGVGYPEAVEPVEFSPCKYQFKWTSLYACPLCTAQDYTPVYGACENGKTTKSYLPKNFPNRCHGGVPNPPPEVVPCTAVTKNCSSGSYFPLTSTSSDECVLASPGHFTIGGGYFIDIFSSIDSFPPVFSRDFSWVPHGEFVMSGAGDTSMSASIYLVQYGYVSFVYKVVASGLSSSVSDGGFYFDIDGITYIRASTTTYYRYSTSVVQLQPGTHYLRWRFIGGQLPTSNSRGYYAVIDKISIFGTEFSARQEIPCREGYYQNLTGQSSCRECRSNTKSTAGQALCSPCPNSTYSLRGSSDCEFSATCQERDYTITYSECRNGMRTKYYSPLHPVLCTPGTKPLFTDNATSVPCPACPVGFVPSVSNEGLTTCTPCVLGTYFSGGVCKPVPAGYRSNTQITYFNSADVLPAVPFSDSQPWKLFPAEFSTVCTGKCGTNGWRVANRSVESGFHSVLGEVDSELFMETMFVQEGSISFTYTLSGLKAADEATDNGLPGFEFFIDGFDEDRSVLYRPQEDRPTKAVVTKIAPGRHVFHWVFHQPWGSNRQLRLILSDIQVNGTSKGTALDYSSCPRGTYSIEGSYICVPCPPGTSSTEHASSCYFCPPSSYSDVFGAATCESCGLGVKATADRTGCDTSECVFSNIIDDKVYTFNLSALSRPVSILSPTQGHRLEFNLCNKLTIESQCFDEKNRLLNSTYQCVVNLDNGVGKDAGKIFNVFFDHADLRIRYSKGASCSSSSSQIYTDINFICDPSVTSFVPPVVATDAPCHIQYDWAHIAGCRVCTEEDYEVQHGDCIDGMQSIVSVRTQPCNGPEAHLLGQQKCIPTFSASIPLVAFGVAIFVFLLLALIVVGIRNKKMADQYELLLQNSSVRSDSSVNTSPDEVVNLDTKEDELEK